MQWLIYVYERDNPVVEADSAVEAFVRWLVARGRRAPRKGRISVFPMFSERTQPFGLTEDEAEMRTLRRQDFDLGAPQTLGFMAVMATAKHERRVALAKRRKEKADAQP